MPPRSGVGGGGLVLGEKSLGIALKKNNNNNNNRELLLILHEPTQISPSWGSLPDF